MKQQSLFIEEQNSINNWKVSCFSADNFNCQDARLEIEEKYIKITEVTDLFNRQSVSYQLSKKDILHKWLKYKEGFSADLVRQLLKDFKIKKGEIVIDPFIGSGTTALVCRMNGINSIGYDILPMSKVAIDAKEAVYQYDIEEIRNVINLIQSMVIPNNYTEITQSVSITKNAYPLETEREISYFTEFFNNSNYSSEIKNLVTLCFLNSLERASYSAKDGQYLRWDYRCPKIIAAEKQRLIAGKKPFATRLDKGELPAIKITVITELQTVLEDIIEIKRLRNDFNEQPRCSFWNSSALYELPKLEDNIISGVITSPPYCNRYDYTRTYALELAYLGVGETELKRLRQDLLSCTVENKSKIDYLKEHYRTLGKVNEFENILGIAQNNKTLKEINSALSNRNLNGDINNKGVLKMVDGYFTELTFIYAELFRLCKSGAQVAFVNDNVRYGGEVIPVDFLSTELAEQIGFIPVRIYTLKQQKGNSSQQMKKFGRIALRKSITIWKKP